MFSRDPLTDPAHAIRRVYSYVAFRLGGGPDAEDVTSQVIERALRYRSSYDRRRGGPESWLLGIARNCVDNALRERNGRVGELEEMPGSASIEADTIERMAVADAVARLEPRDRELVALRYGADLSTREIASLLELKTNAVDVALHRCRTRLRGELERAGYGETPHSPYLLAPAMPHARP